MKRINILITAAGGASGINCICALRSQDEIPVSIIGADADVESAGIYLVDNHYIIPNIMSDSYIPRLLEICEKERVDVLLPTFSGEISLLANCVDKFTALNVRLLLPDLSVAQMFNDKWLTYKFFKDNGIPTPTTWLLSSFNSNDPAIEFPLFVKPVYGSGAKENCVVNSVEDIEYLRRNQRSPFIVQDFIKAREFTVDALSNSNYSLVTAVVRERLRVKDGKSIVAETFKDDRVVPITEKIIRLSRIVGPFNIQYFLAKDNSLSFLEVNPRFAAGGLALATKVGVNIPLMTIKIALGMEVEPKLEYPIGIKMLRYLTEIFLDRNGSII